jgi:hypothetical protein
MKTRQKWHLSWKLFVENFTNVTVNIFARISLKTNMTRCDVKKKCLISVFITGMGINFNVCPFSFFFCFLHQQQNRKSNNKINLFSSIFSSTEGHLMAKYEHNLQKTPTFFCHF